MLSSIRMAGDGMQAGLDKLEITAQNLANVNTVGYKKNMAITNTFKTSLEQAINNVPAMRVDSSISYAQGTLQFTKNEYDFAIDGDGFFAVEKEDQVVYTRAGTFQVGTDGVLKTSTGESVLDDSNAPIEVQNGKLTIDEKGNIYIDGKRSASIGVYDFPKPYKLEKIGNAQFYFTGENNDVNPAEDFKVMQGYVERSNVSSLEAMIEMINIITTVRNTESSKEVIKIQDQSLSKVINELGRG